MSNSKYAVTVTLGITAKNADEARDKMKKIIESSSAVHEDKFLSVKLSESARISAVKI